MSKKIIGLCFSGGLDSTYLLWKNLELGNRVICIYTEIENNKNKSLCELDTIKKIINVFEKKYGIDKIFQVQNKISINGTPLSIFTQIPIHIFSILNSDRCDEFQIGYCMNDDAISYLKEIQNIWKSYGHFFDVKQPKLTFPLLKVSKYFMLRELPYEIKELVFSCENPHIIDEVKKEYKICGHCDPCKKYQSMDISLPNLVYNKHKLLDGFKESEDYDEVDCQELEDYDESLDEKISEKNI